MQGVQRVLRAAGLEAARVAQPGFEQVAVSQDQTDQRLPRHVSELHGRVNAATGPRRTPGLWNPERPEPVAAMPHRVQTAPPAAMPVKPLKRIPSEQNPGAGAPPTSPRVGELDDAAWRRESADARDCGSLRGGPGAWVTLRPTSVGRRSHPQALLTYPISLWISHFQPRLALDQGQHRAARANGEWRSGHFVTKAGLTAGAGNRCCAQAGRSWPKQCAKQQLTTARSRSGSQAFAALGATGLDDGTATAGLHAHEKTVGTGTAGLGGLISALHHRSCSESYGLNRLLGLLKARRSHSTLQQQQDNAMPTPPTFHAWLTPCAPHELGVHRAGKPT